MSDNDIDLSIQTYWTIHPCILQWLSLAMTQYYGLELEITLDLVHTVHDMMVSMMSSKDKKIEAYDSLRPAVYP